MMVNKDRVKLDIRSIFSPIEEDLQKVEKLLRETAHSDFGPLAEVINSTIGSGGKRIRPALVLISGRLHPVNDDHLLRLAASVELLHVATLIHDDLLDKSMIRRGAPTISSRWSEKATVLAGDFLLARGAKMAAEVKNFDVMEIISEAVAVICEGEIRQDFEGNHVIPSRDAYYGRIYAKTASLFGASAEAAAFLGHAPVPARHALREYGRNLGMAFQISDDILDFVGTEREVGKPIGSDLRQGLATLPAIYFFEKDPRRDVLTRAFSHDGKSPAELERVIDWIAGSSAIQSSRLEARQFAKRAQAALEPLPESPYRSSLEALANFVVERDK